MSDGGAVLFADLALARRLERAEALSNARFVEARARLFPERGACWINVAGAYAMFDGPSSPSTQTFGLGIFEVPTAADLEQLEAFFRERGAPTFHEVSPLADAAVVPQLIERGYQPFEFTSVLYRPIDQAGLKACTTPTRDDVAQASVRVRLIEKGEEDLFARTAAAGWHESGFGDFMLEYGRVNLNTQGLHLFIAELDGQPIATGAVNLSDGVAHLAGASTIPEGRKRGAQLALLDHRLRYAAGHGCDIALMGALPGRGSQRNAERHGFRIAYTRIKWKR
jgi:GNAT superfamily N-acetyltransferase